MPLQPITTSLVRIQTDPQGIDPKAVAFFDNSTTIDGVLYNAPWQQVSWPIRSTTKKVTVADQTLTYAQVSDFIVAIAYQEKAEQSPKTLSTI